MLTVVTATAFAGAAQLAIKRTLIVGVVVVVVAEFLIIELRIRIAKGCRMVGLIEPMLVTY